MTAVFGAWRWRYGFHRNARVSDAELYHGLSGREIRFDVEPAVRLAAGGLSVQTP